MDQLMRSMPLIADIAAGTVLFCFVVLRGSRGLSRTILPIAATIVAAAGAIMLTSAFRERAIEAIYPWMRDQLLARMDLSSIRSRLMEDVAPQLEKLLPELVKRYAGWLELDVGAFVAQAIEHAPFAAGQSIAEEAVSSLLLPISEELISSVMLALLFLLLRLGLGALVAASGIVPQLPIIGLIDRLLGAVVGFLECCLILWLLVRLFHVLGITPVLEVLAQTRLLSKLLP